MFLTCYSKIERNVVLGGMPKPQLDKETYFDKYQ